MAGSTEALRRELEAQLDAAPPGTLCVAFSGGSDSTALLHALCALPAARKRGLSALHIDHGLHPDSAKWAAHCAELCRQLDVTLQVQRVRVDRIDELGIEAAARRARHAAFARHLADGGVMALAQHQDDQAETLLLRLLHGAGNEGLAGMRRLRRCAGGWLWRPCLALPRQVLRAHAQGAGLAWIEDPANRDPRFARSHLRGQVLPALAARWPDAARRIAAAAARLREEDEVLDAEARRLLAQLQGVDPATVATAPLRTAPVALRRRALGLWLDQLGLPRPPAPVWARLQPELLDARADATPRLAWCGAELRRYRDLLYAMPPLPPALQDWALPWIGEAPLVLPPGFGVLRLEPPVRLDGIEARPRRGGERLQQPGARRELRTLLQDLGVPPWQRERMPMLYAAGEAVAAADLALAPEFAARLRAAGTRLRWHPAGTRCEPIRGTAP